jgi:pilus assembly protein CpaD
MSSSNRPHLKERPSMRATLWLASLSLLALGACATDPSHAKKAAADPPPVTPSERYAIQVNPDPLELKLGVHDSGLSQNQADALHDFVGHWMQTDRAPITIKAPEHGPAQAAVYRTATGARDLLIGQGVAPAEVRIVGYEAADDRAAPVVVGFVRYQARGPQCGKDWSDLSKDFENNGYAEFGCSVTANIAAQIAEPADLLHPRDADAPDAQRRETVLDKYRQGATTATVKDSQANGAVSATAQQ